MIIIEASDSPALCLLDSEGRPVVGGKKREFIQRIRSYLDDLEGCSASLIDEFNALNHKFHKDGLDLLIRTEEEAKQQESKRLKDTEKRLVLRHIKHIEDENAKEKS